MKTGFKGLSALTWPHFKNSLGILFFLSVLCVSGFTQISTTPEVRFFSKEDLDAPPRNWSVASDSLGRVFIGNDIGLLIYNGHEFESFHLPNFTSVRSIQVHQDTIWVGGQDEIGYLLDNTGKWNFTSLKSRIPSAQRSFTDVWFLIKSDEALSFLSNDAIYNLSDEVKIYHDQTSVPQMFSFRGEQIHLGWNRGLLYFEDGKKNLIPGSTLFAQRNFRYCENPIDSLGYFFTEDNKVYTYDGDTFVDISSQISQEILNLSITSVIPIDNGFAIGTREDGVFMSSLSLHNLIPLSDDRRFIGNEVRALSKDLHGNIWVALNNGIAYVDLHGGIQQVNGFSSQAGFCMAEYNGEFFWGTNEGVFIGKGNDKMLIDYPLGQAWDLNVVNDELWLSHQEGCFYYRNGRFVRVEDTYGSWKVLPLQKDIVVEGNYFGVSLLKKINGEWKKLFSTNDFGESSRFMALYKKEELWVAHPYKGIFRLSVDLENNEIYLKEKLGPEHGMESDLLAHLFQLDNDILISSPEGLFRFDFLKNHLDPDEDLMGAFDTELPIKMLEKGPKGRLWFTSANETGVLKQIENGYDKLSLSSLPRRQVFGFENVQFWNEDVVFGVDEGFITYREDNRKGNTFTVEIKAYNAINQSFYPEDNIRIGPEENGIRFQFLSNFQTRTKDIKYRWRLVGQNSSWNEWNEDNHKSYSKLDPGQYQFELEGVNKGVIDRSIWKFEILPPWYLSTLAKVLYGVLAFVVLSSLMLFPNLKYREEKEKLISENMASQEEIERLKMEKLQDEINYKNRQLASSTMHVLQKNETFNKLKEMIEKIRRSSNDVQISKELKSVLSLLNDDIRLNEDWDKFAQYFDEVHSDFTVALKNNYPTLTARDIKLCAYLKMNLTTKEIAPLMNISPRGVEISRYRLRKKLGIDKSINLNEFMNTL